MSDENERSEDVIITIAVAPAKKVWANRIHYSRNGATARNAGVLPASSTAHTGLAIAATHALKSVSQTRLGKTKLSDATVRVVTEDRLFAHAIDQLAAHQRVTTLKSARSLFMPLARAINRSKIVTQVLPSGDNEIQTVKGWGINMLTPEIEDRVSLRVFTPKHVTESRSVKSRSF